MKKFAISWVSFFDYSLHIDECYAKNYKDALLFILANKLGYDTEYELTQYTEDQLHEFAFDTNYLIQALQTYGD